MTREEHLVFCKKCKNRYLDFNKGLLCKLTEKPAAFEGECPSFENDSTVINVLEPKETIRPNKERAKWAEYLIWALLGISAISMVSSYLQYDLLLKLQEGFYVSDQELTLNDLREGGIGIAIIIVYIFSVVTFIRWFRRAYYNLHSRTLTPKYDEGWAAGSWFVPILNLFRPYHIMKEIDEETALLIEKRRQKPVKKSSTLIGFWWALWILNGIFGRYVFRTAMDAETIDELMHSSLVDIGSMAFEIPLGILAILVIRAVSSKEVLLEQLENEDEQIQQAQSNSESI